MRPATAFLIPVLILSFALRLSARPTTANNKSALLADTTVIDTIPPADDRHGTDDADPAPSDSTRTDDGLRDGGYSSPDYLNGVINAPEQPEGAAFTPTMMGDIEAASPTAGINIIAPPSANNHGTAALQYPFIMPPARNGMSPTLGLAYDSDAGDGICGEGWTLPVPSITVDTRWGVPRYDTVKETETYLMDGRMLAMQVGDSLYLAHRRPGIDRNIDDTLRRFHPRTGTDFSLVERVGTSPGSYHWRVTAPDGTVYTYGDGNAKLKGSFTDASGATREVVSEWLLSRIEEPHGDHVTYHYHTANEAAIGGLSATAVYLDSVKAGNAEGPEHTVVTFHYALRGDGAMKTCSARYGFLTSSHQLLDTVVVRFLGDTLRSYVLQYAEGRFGRPLLTKVTHYDDHGNAAAFQEFSYYDDVSGTDGLVNPQNNSMVITSGDDDLDVELILNHSERNPSLLGSSSTQSKSVSLYAGVGVWDGSQWKGNTAGASYEYSDDQTMGVVTLTDIDGDGLPDKVFRKSDGLWYRPMLHSADGGMYFGAPVKLAASAGSFSTVKSHTNNIGVRGVVGMYDITYQRGHDWHSTKSRTTEYMADVNGDGLPDLVSNGRVWFNHLDISGGTPVPTFTEGSHLSPNPIIYTAAPDSSVVSAPTSEQFDSIADDSPMQDVVRVWEAPRDGRVRVYGGVSLQPPPSGYDEAEYAKADGVRVAIEKAGATLWCKTILRDDHATYQPEGVSSIAVSRGERIYFRLQCGAERRSNGAFDRVAWSPTVQYTTGMFPTMPNGETMGFYSSTEGIVGSAFETASTEGSTSIRIRGRIVKPATSDHVTFLAIAANDLVDSLGHPMPGFQTDTIFKKTYQCHETVNLQVDTVVNNSLHLPYVRMMITSPTNVKWQALKWMPSVICIDSLGREHETSLMPSVNAYTMTFQEPVPFIVDSQGATVSVVPSLALPDSLNGRVSLVVKGSNGIWERKEYLVTNGVIAPNDTLSLNAPGSGLAWVELYWPDTLGINTPVTCSASVKVNTISASSSFTAGFHARRADLSMGLMHRGWGGFIYSAAGERFENPIDESLLHAPEVQENDTLRFEQLVFTPLTTKADSLGNLSWSGPRDEIYITNSYMGTARLGEQDISWSNPISTGYTPSTFGNLGEAWTGAPAPILVSSSKGRTEQGELSIPVPISGFTESSSKATTKGDVTFLDMNADGYPDIVANGVVQYTNTHGGMSGESIDGMPRPESFATSKASGVGGTPVNAASTIVSVVSGGRVSASGRLTSQLGKISVSGSGNRNLDSSAFDYEDLNGDGLPDLLYDDDGTLKARINLGYAFSNNVEIGTGHIQRGVSQSSNKGVSAGDSLCFGGLLDGTDVNKASASFSAGVGLASTISREEECLADVNGDGLPDIVETDVLHRTWARLNMGDSFAAPILLAGTRGAWESTTHGESANAAFTVTINVPSIGMKFCVNPGGAFGRSLTKTRTSIRDIDGDGFPDLVTSNSEDSLSVRFSSIRRTNKLKTVTNSLGGTFTLDYAHTTPTYGLPGGKWVMSSIDVDRGIHFTGCDIPVTRTAFEYSGGVRDRREREFLGFAEVVSTDLDARNGYAEYRSVKETFDVSSFYRRGLPLASTLQDAQGNKYTEVSNTYHIYSVRPDASNTLRFSLDTIAPSDTLPMSYTPVKLSENLLYEGGNTPVRTQSGYVYKTQDCGEVATYYHSSDGTMTEAGTGFTGYDYRTDISYSYAQANNSDQRRTISRPGSVVVMGVDGIEYHRTRASYLSECNAAKVESITRNFSVSSNDTTIVRFTYDGRGNLKSVEQNSGTPGGGTYKQSYMYDEDHYLKSYPYLTEDSHGLDTFIKGMDMRYGRVTEVKDPNGNILHTIFDGLGRLSSMRSPKEDTDSSTVDMAYAPVAVMKADGTGIQTPAHAVTTYHLRQPYETTGGLSSTHSDTMRVVTFVDGFGQVVQTRKESVIDSGSGSPVRKVVVNGGAVFDGLGRATKAYYPVQADSSLLMTYQAAAQANAYGVATEYDVLDRPTKVTTPDGKETLYAYDVAGGRLRTTVTDANGIESETHTDASGRTVKTVMFSDMENRTPVETRYLYDPVGRLAAVINALGDSTLVSYDMLDRRTEVLHPASGVTRWTYDKLGNVLTEENETLRAQGEKLRYTWDVDRLTAMECPDDTVTYVYGQSSNTHLTNIIGRPRFRLDRSGGTEYGYDAMGNVSYEKRTMVVPQKGLATFETAWEYDSYGKLLRMTYPGDEKVTYHYNASGDLDRVYRGKEDAGRDYVSYIGYDRFGDRVRVSYGNGTETRYTYNARTRRLTTATSRLNGTTRASRSYLYDNVGNVFKISGASPVNYTYFYDYDDLYRLVSCTQRYGSGNAVATDTLTMAYDDLWRVTSKSQRLAQKGLMFPGTLNTGYDMDYSYGTEPGKHYQLKDVAETSYRTSATPTLADNILSTHSYSYDPNGNLAYESVARKRIDNSTTRNISERKLLWDAQNRLRAISEDGYVSLYWYDAGGNRTVKEHLGGEAVWVNSAPAGQRTDTVTYTIYPSPYISVTGDRWTKHYYVGSERIASRTGTLSGGFASLNIGDSNSAGNGLGMTIDYGVMCSAEEASIDSIYARFGVPYVAQHGGTNRENGWHLYLPVSYEREDGDNTADISNTTQDRNLPHLNGDSQVYFYHRDHLGSTMSVTDSLGATVQLVEYTPWGEVFVERRFGSSGYESPYLFNGKELDEETGLYYYGARYYDPKLSVWYSVDRFAEKYPFASPYNYALSNPLKYIDLYGDTVIWATDINSFITRLKVNNLREHSMVFNTLYNKLDSSPSLYYLSANDKQVQKDYRKESKWMFGKSGGYAYGNTVVFSELYADVYTFSEELFHLFQKSIYGDSRMRQELDAEAKLFNSVVSTEVGNKYPTLLGINAVTNMIKIDNPSSYDYLNGQLIVTLINVADTHMQVLNNTNGAVSYFNYLKEFEILHGQKVGDVYKGAQRKLLPKAYNLIIKSVK